jgi:hypothetical protein
MLFVVEREQLFGEGRAVFHRERLTAPDLAVAAFDDIALGEGRVPVFQAVKALQEIPYVRRLLALISIISATTSSWRSLARAAQGPTSAGPTGQDRPSSFLLLR